MTARALTLALAAATVFAACSPQGLAGKLQGRWIADNGYTAQFSGNTLREHIGIGASSMDFTSPITYTEPDGFEKPGMTGSLYHWRVIFDDRDHIELIPPNSGVAPIQHLRRK